MAAKKIKVIYLDGREAEVLVSPRAQVMTEEHVGGITSERALLATFYLGWASLYKAGKESADFETWLDLITDVEEIDEERPDPTPPAPSGDTSSGSVS